MTFRISLLPLTLLAFAANSAGHAQNDASRVSTDSVKRASAGTVAASLKFTPVPGDAALRKFADDLGKNPQERQQLLQAITATKASFEQKYGARRWTNNVAGAYAFFVVSIGYVLSGTEPGAAEQNHVFEVLTTTLATSPDLAKASNADKAAMYDTVIASSSLPLLLYIDGLQQNNAAEMEQARALAAEYSRKIMHMEPQQLVAMLKPSTDTRASPVVSESAPSEGVPGLDGRYDCQMLSVRAGGSFSVEYRPIGLWFSIRGKSYSANGGGGTVDATASVVSFHGGAYDGWRGARIHDAIVFRKDNHSDPRPGDGIRNGDIRCGSHR